MKTVRFATAVKKYGEPEAHLVLTSPIRDRTLQAAIKQGRVMTIFQRVTGQAADQGVVGFESGTGRQFLIFPKSLRALSGAKIVGIKYDLWKTKTVPKAERAAPSRPPAKLKSRTRKPHLRSTAPPNVLPFKNEDEPEEDPSVTELKKIVGHAMNLLEDGKTVAAFNLLKRIMES